MDDTAQAVQDFNIKQFRRKVKEKYPHVKISIRTVGFSDLARASKKALTVSGERQGELAEINAWAKEAGILPDSNIRFYKEAV